MPFADYRADSGAVMSACTQLARSAGILPAHHPPQPGTDSAPSADSRRKPTRSPSSGALSPSLRWSTPSLGCPAGWKTLATGRTQTRGRPHFWLSPREGCFCWHRIAGRRSKRQRTSGPLSVSHSRAAGLPASLCCHSFRSTTATDLFTQGVPLEDVQYLLGHADPRTTRFYDRTKRQVTGNIVERIST
ncbi:MAG: tyrosine-type recombinase/integrase [Phycisphaerales bacterium]|nr:MAG: tyrosine-type recombinase/integrase [Phycisphaerales bacterium]